MQPFQGGPARVHEHGTGRTFSAAEFSALIAVPRFQILISGKRWEEYTGRWRCFYNFQNKKLNEKKGGGLENAS